MPKTICILAAGQGTRMGHLTKNINKAIIPFNKKAITSHIIEKFPQDSLFIIAVGYHGEKTKSYLKLAHPNLNIEFVNINNYNEVGSGPGTSLLACKEKIPGSFYFVACDTLWEDINLTEDSDWFGVSKTSSEDAINYCNFELSNSQIINIVDKALPTKYFKSFIGLGYIKNYLEFWNALEISQSQSEKQISEGIKGILKFKPEAKEIKWIDLGTKEKYIAELEKIEKFNFSKSDENLYIVNNQVIKFFANPEIANNRVNRTNFNPNIFPKINGSENGFYSYSFINGRTLYEYCTPEVFKELLLFLSSNLWIESEIDCDFNLVCKKFYQDKTLERLALYLKSRTEGPNIINGESFPEIKELIKKIPWGLINTGGVPSGFHGDLQFDNIVYNRDDKKFTLLDWRQDFGGLFIGDLYYDLAKLNGGLDLQYDLIKNGLLFFEEKDQEQVFDYGKRFLSKIYKQLLKEFVNTRGLDWYKVEIITALIYLNMSPLHEAPFDKILFALAKSKLSRLLN